MGKVGVGDVLRDPAGMDKSGLGAVRVAGVDRWCEGRGGDSLSGLAGSGLSDHHSELRLQ